MLRHIIRQRFADHILRRMLKNTSWLLSGRVITMLANLAYLSIATHHLGVAVFGMLVVVQTYIDIIANLTTFQSWQAVIRYGSKCLQQQDKGALQQLVKFTTLLDILGVALGIAFAVSLAGIIGPFAGWPQSVITQVEWCSLSIAFTVVATPTGLLRLYNRFDLLAWQSTVFYLAQLVGIIVCVIVDVPFWGYLVTWVVAKALSGILLIALGWKEAWQQGLLTKMSRNMMGFSQSHPGLWRFCLASNFNSSLPMLMRKSTPLIIGLVGSSSAVGLFRISAELSAPLKTIAQMLNQSLYPELAHLGTQQHWQQFKSLTLKTSVLSTGIGIVLLGGYLCLGKTLLFYSFGADFKDAYVPLLLLVSAEVFTAISCALEPALYAMGKPGLPLRTNTLVILGIYTPSLILLTERWGAMGAGLTTLMSTVLLFLINAALTGFQLRKNIKQQNSV